MALTRVLITVKTYPTISSKYDELVCTAGFTEFGDWIRIYPIQFRKLSYAVQYKKYDWIEIDLMKNNRDFRPESHRPVSLESYPHVVDHLDTQNNWKARKEIVLRNVYDDLDLLIKEAKNPIFRRSLAVFKPTRILNLRYYFVGREWSKKKLRQQSQMNLFETKNGELQIVKKLPYKFVFEFEDINGRASKMMIEDWELGALFWKYENEAEACEMVRRKYFDELAMTKDLYFFLGTTQSRHLTSKNPFMIIGTFYPNHSNTIISSKPKSNQLDLFA